MISLKDLMVQGPTRGARLFGTTLAIDPGETIGWAFFEGSVLKEYGQLKSKEFTWGQIYALRQLFNVFVPQSVVIESYRVYKWKTDSHAWNEMHTSQIIGVCRYLALEHQVPYHFQSAQIAKQFCTDDKLRAWGMIATGQQHARDAIRHGACFQVFGPPAEK